MALMTGRRAQPAASYIAARKALAQCRRVDEVKSIRDKAIAMEVYAYQQRDPQLAGDAAEIKMRALRRLGQLMELQRKAGLRAKGTRGAGRPKKGGVRKTPPKGPTLKSQGVDKNLGKKTAIVAGLEQRWRTGDMLACAQSRCSGQCVRISTRERRAGSGSWWRRSKPVRPCDLLIRPALSDAA
jgi:hypothetical protein